MSALALALCMLLLGGLADLYAESRSLLELPMVLASTAGAAALLLAGDALESFAARRDGPRGRVDLWRATSFAAVATAFAAYAQVDPVFTRSYHLSGTTGRWTRLEPEFFAVPLAALLAGLVLRRLPVPAYRSLRRRAIVSLCAAAALVALAGVRAWRGVAPWRFLDTLPRIGRVPAPSPGAPVVSRVGPYLVRREHIDHNPYNCPFRVSRAGAAEGEAALFDCRSITLRALHESGEVIALVEREEGDPAYRSWRVLDAETGAAVPSPRASLGMFADRLAPPRGWVVGSALLLALGLLALARRRETDRWLAARPRWREGVLDARGVVSFRDGGSGQVGYGAVVPPGPVVVLDVEAPVGSAPFRDGARGAVAASDVRAGTVASVEADLESSRDAYLARLTATALLAAAPLVPFALRGMVL